MAEMHYALQVEIYLYVSSLTENVFLITKLISTHSSDGNRSGRPAGRVTGLVEILRPSGQAG